MTRFSLAGVGTDEQWNQLVGDWYAGKGLSEAWQKSFEVAADNSGRTGLSNIYDNTLAPYTGQNFSQFGASLGNDPAVRALPFVLGTLSVEANLARSAAVVGTSEEVFPAIKAGSSGGPTAYGRFSAAIKREAIADAQNQARAGIVRCQRRTEIVRVVEDVRRRDGHDNRLLLERLLLRQGRPPRAAL